MERDDGLSLPVLKPVVARHLAVVLVRLTVTLSPVIILAPTKAAAEEAVQGIIDGSISTGVK